MGAPRGGRLSLWRDEGRTVLGYVLRRLLWMIPVLYFVVTITFFLMHAVPGGPWDGDRKLPQTTIDNLNRIYNLDQPLHIQYWRYLRNLVQGDLGVSFRGDRPVLDRLREGLPITATLGITSFIFGTVAGLTLGTVAALKQNGPLDYASVVLSTLGASMPSFVIASFLIVLIAVNLRLTPIIGWREPIQVITDPRAVILPVIALSFRETAVLTRITRASVLEVIRQDYVRTARAKGLVERVVIVRHLLKNALIPVLTLLGPTLAALVTGSFIIESIFSIPGIGRAFVESVVTRDYGMIMGTTLFYAIVVTFANLVVDVMYAVVDPRIRYS
ncbi:MAG: ABC transporter permease [Dehalococcoidia bacterium]